MRCALSTTVPKIDTLVLKKHNHHISYKTCADDGTTDFYCLYYYYGHKKCNLSFDHNAQHLFTLSAGQYLIS